MPATAKAAASEAEPKHTPGPWTALSPAAWASDQWVIPGVAHCGNGELSEANARLIAAAPDMRDSLDPDTLEAIADEIDCFEHSARAGSLRGIAKRQRAALAKTEGRS